MTYSHEGKCNDVSIIRNSGRKIDLDLDLWNFRLKIVSDISKMLRGMTGFKVSMMSTVYEEW